MPSTGTPASNSAGSTCGASSAYTDAGPPERITAAGAELRVLGAVVDDQHGAVLALGEPLGRLGGIGCGAAGGGAVREDLVGGVTGPAGLVLGAPAGRSGRIGCSAAHV